MSKDHMIASLVRMLGTGSYKFVRLVYVFAMSGYEPEE